jgi:uncharacterized membrane protein YjgN (DUF898 family)
MSVLTLPQPAMPGGPGEGVSFHGRRRALTGLLLRVGLLNIVTLGIYRFWAKTHLRRYFWNSLAVRGDALEYTGRASELLLGFLIVLAILVPIGLVYSTAEFVVTTFAPGALPAVDVAYVGTLLMLSPLALYRARRYRLTRTVWRGIRFGQDGSAVRYMVLAVGYGLLTVLTLGFAYPWMRVALQRYKIGHTRFGDRSFTFEGRGIDLLAPWLWVCIAIVTTLAVLMASLWTPIADLLRLARLGAAQPGDLLALMGQAPVLFGLSFSVVAFALFVRYRAQEFHYFVAATRFGAVHFSAALRLPTVLLIAILYLAALIAAFVVIAMLVASIIAAAGPASAGTSPLLPLSLPLVIIVAFFVVVPLVKYVVLYHALLSHVCARFRISDLDAIETVVADMRARPRYGEGLADALDVDMGAI